MGLYSCGSQKHSSIHSIIGTSWENIGKSIDNPLYMEVLNSFHGYSNYINGG
jgi:hypothetical protein